MKSKNFVISLYEVKYKVTIFETEEEFTSHPDAHEEDEKIPIPRYGKFIVFQQPDGSFRFHIMLSHTATMGDIVHECDHFCNFILDKIGWIADLDNDEPHAYLLQFIFNQVSRFFFDWLCVNRPERYPTLKT